MNSVIDRYINVLGYNIVMITKYKLDTSCHAVFSLNYHFIQCVKYRKHALVNPLIIEELKQRTKNIAQSYGIRITNIECDKDHVHILFASMPKIPITKFINNWKTATSRVIRNKFPEVKELLWKDVFWSPSYCLLTTGQATLTDVSV